MLLSACSTSLRCSAARTPGAIRIFGDRKVVSLGIVCCLLSGLFTLGAVALQSVPALAISALLIGRIFLGVGESFTATGQRCGELKPWGNTYFASDPWNGVATYAWRWR